VFLIGCPVTCCNISNRRARPLLCCNDQQQQSATASVCLTTPQAHLHWPFAMLRCPVGFAAHRTLVPTTGVTCPLPKTSFAGQGGGQQHQRAGPSSCRMKMRGSGSVSHCWRLFERMMRGGTVPAQESSSSLRQWRCTEIKPHGTGGLWGVWRPLSPAPLPAPQWLALCWQPDWHLASACSAQDICCRCP